MSEEKEFWKHFVQMVLRAEIDAKMCNWQRNVFIDDWHGIRLEYYASKSAIAQSVAAKHSVISALFNW